MGCTPSAFERHASASAVPSPPPSQSQSPVTDDQPGNNNTLDTDNTSPRQQESEEAAPCNHHERTTQHSGSGTSPKGWRFRLGGKDKNLGKTSLTSSDQKIKPTTGTLSLVQSKANNSVEDPLHVVFCFTKEDNLTEAIAKAAQQLCFTWQLVHTPDQLTNCIDGKSPDVVFIDNRGGFRSGFDGESCARAVRKKKSLTHPILVAIVRKSFFDREEPSILPLLTAGFSRCLVENSSVGFWLNELTQLHRGEVSARRFERSSHLALQTAVDKARDVVTVTDSHFVIQYMNAAAERVMGLTASEKGRSMVDVLHIDNQELMRQQLSRGHEWVGVCTVRLKPPLTGTTLLLNCRVIPAAAANGRAPNHYVFINESPPSYLLGKRMSDGPSILPLKERDGSTYQPAPRGSLHSVRRGSVDIRSINSEGFRRLSVAKLNNLPIEAPITRVVTLLSAAQEVSSPQVAQTIEKAVEILRTAELYSPTLRDDKMRTGDPVANDLIGALLTGAPPPMSVTRRSSNDSAASKSAGAGAGSVALPGKASLKPTLHAVQLNELLNSTLLWEFNVFRLENLSARRPLVHTGVNVMAHFEVTSTLGIDETTLYNWLALIEHNYKSTNTYHNSTHAADVLQACACFLEKERLKQLMDSLDEACCLIAAVAHDIDHPGKSSAFLCNASTDLAILYNDICVLESHHAAFSFKLTLSEERFNIFKGLERDVYKVVRQSVIDMILATDMTKHFEHLAKFVNVFTRPSPSEEDPVGSLIGSDAQDLELLNTPENIVLVKRMLIKCADVSNPSRPLNLCIEWAHRIAEEYFNQTDEEKASNLPVVMPMFDRATCSIPKSQIGFMDYIVNDMFEAWESFIDMPELLTYLDNNYKFWKEMDDLGVTTFKELKATPQMAAILAGEEANIVGLARVSE